MPPIKASRFPRAFKAWDIQDQKFYMPEEVLPKLGLTLTADGLPYWIKEPREIVICWFTQQTDSNKEPLFEGEICRMEVQTPFGVIQNVLGVMRWLERDSRFILIMAGTDPNQQYATLKVEKIGHEITHPELLAKIESGKVNG